MSSFYNQPYIGRVQHLNVEKSGSRTFAVLNIKMKSKVHTIDIGLNNQMTPYNKNYEKPSVFVQNLSMNQRKIGTTIMNRLYGSSHRSRSPSRSTRRRRSKSRRSRSKSRSPSRRKSPNPAMM